MDARFYTAVLTIFSRHSTPHDYGPGIYPQPWFFEPDFPKNLPKIWEKYWGFSVGHTPILLGEFGGRSVNQGKEGLWQQTLVEYLKEHGVHYTYWVLNPDSVDTGGLLQDDWMTVNQEKLDLLSTYQWPLLGERPTPVRPIVSVPLRAEQGILKRETAQVHITGINWFGMETETQAPHGLWVQPWQKLLDFIVEAGFNTIRLPFSDALFNPRIQPQGGIDFSKNPDLVGVKKLDLLDLIIEGAGERGIKIILDRHRPTPPSFPGEPLTELWYSDKEIQAGAKKEDLERRWIDNWVKLATCYQGNATVIGADLHNEPHGRATWGDGNADTDWKLAAEKAGNKILEANPDWLIFVEGIENFQGNSYWQGGNLMGARMSPVNLTHPEKLVYSAHDYGPGVWPQQWFDAPHFPDNLVPDIWMKNWAFLMLDPGFQQKTPVLIGEFGGRSVRGDLKHPQDAVQKGDKEGIWQQMLVSFLKEHQINYTYWALNPNSTDTGGLLHEDWTTIDSAKLALLSTYQWPIGLA